MLTKLKASIWKPLNYTGTIWSPNMFAQYKLHRDVAPHECFPLWHSAQFNTLLIWLVSARVVVSRADHFASVLHDIWPRSPWQLTVDINPLWKLWFVHNSTIDLEHVFPPKRHKERRSNAKKLVASLSWWSTLKMCNHLTVICKKTHPKVLNAMQEQNKTTNKPHSSPLSLNL